MAEFIIADDATRFITDASFDVDTYHGYLDSRGVSSTNAGNLQIILTNEEVGAAAVANTTPAFLNHGGPHIIRISPTKLTSNARRQSAVLRHETEHFIQGCDWRYPTWAVSQLGFVGLSSVGFAIMSSQSILEATEALPDPLRIGLTGVGALGSFAVGAVASSAIGKMFNPLEFQATRAQTRYQQQLPDGVLTVHYAD